MKHHLFSDIEPDKYPIAILMKESSFFKKELEEYYIEPLNLRGIIPEEVIAFTLAYNATGKAPVPYIKDYLSNLLKVLENLQAKYLYCTDAAYFKVLTNQRKADPHFGYALPCAIKGYEHMTVVLGLNYRQLIYNPELYKRLDLSLDTLSSAVNGSYTPIGQGIIHSAQYPSTTDDIKQALNSLHQYPRLFCDIEAFSLRFDRAGVGTIAFAWDQHNGIAIPVEYNKAAQSLPHTLAVRNLLKEFFEAYQGELVFHNASFDVKVLIYNLWMEDLKDTEGLLAGLEIFTRRLHDTKIIAYLATNTTAGNQLSLKTLAHEFAGNWAVEVTNISGVPIDSLLQYNLIDTLSTAYVFDKYLPIMEADNQGDLYRGLFLDSLKLIIQMELTGMPMSYKRIQEVKAELIMSQTDQLTIIQGHPIMKTLNLLLQESAMESANAKLKKKQHPLDHFSDVAFNPNSGPQLQRLLYELMGLPVLDTTDSGAPATGAETISKLINHTNDAGLQKLLNALVEYGQVTKILSTFIPAFEKAIRKDDSDTVWLHGNFNLGGTVSGRLSSNDPNLQNIPANSTYGKLIKSCFLAAPGWLFCGADFNSLEDYISALTTRDPNKMRVYEEGFDGHCLRAAYYFRDELMHIDLNDPKSVNTIKDTHPKLRQASKTPTFALTYQGTYHTLMKNLGWTEENAKAVEAAYHEMYKVSDEYVQARLKEASEVGYVTVAFGLRVRTPLLKQVIWGNSKMPYEAAAEGRTAGNALGQSYGLLNNRAAVAFFKEVWKSPYKHQICPVALIHDAIYCLVKDDVDALEFANRELIKAMRWQELPEIAHPTVKLGAALDVFWPSWDTATTLPNDASRQEIIDICSKAKQ